MYLFWNFLFPGDFKKLNLVKVNTVYIIECCKKALKELILNAQADDSYNSSSRDYHHILGIYSIKLSFTPLLYERPNKKKNNLLI